MYIILNRMNDMYYIFWLLTTHLLNKVILSSCNEDICHHLIRLQRRRQLHEPEVLGHSSAEEEEDNEVRRDEHEESSEEEELEDEVEDL